MHIRLVAVLGVLCAYGVSAQDVTAAPAIDEPPRADAGDVLVLLNGRILEGFQIVRVGAYAYVVEFAEGVTVDIPRRQVESVVFDEVDLPRGRAAPPREPSTPPRWIEGERVPKRISDQLSVPLAAPDSPRLLYKGQPLDAVIRDVSRRTGVTMVYDKGLGKLPAEQRVWPSSVAPGTTLLSLLEHDLRRLAEVDWTYSQGRIVIYRRQDQGRGKGKAMPHVPKPSRQEEHITTDVAPESTGRNEDSGNPKESPAE
ncbi:MAG: hypothetical protein GY851_33505 [bacterium]|nr:hypothetical protein [bacterium]